MLTRVKKKKKGGGGEFQRRTRSEPDTKINTFQLICFYFEIMYFGDYCKINEVHFCNFKCIFNYQNALFCFRKEVIQNSCNFFLAFKYRIFKPKLTFSFPVTQPTYRTRLKRIQSYPTSGYVSNVYPRVMNKENEVRAHRWSYSALNRKDTLTSATTWMNSRTLH